MKVKLKKIFEIVIEHIKYFIINNYYLVNIVSN